MAENTKTDELRERIVVLLYNASDERDNKSVGETADEVMQLINSEVHQVLDRLTQEGWLDGGMRGEYAPIDRAAFEAERNKYPLNKEEK